VLFANIISQTDVLAVSCLQDKIGDLIAQEGPRLES
jgi:hypothetical protein